MLLQYIGPWILEGWEQPWHRDSCQTQKSQRVLEPCACVMFPPAGKECHVISSLNLPILVMELTGREREGRRDRGKCLLLCRYTIKHSLADGR